MARIAVIVSNPCTGDERVIKMARAAADSGHEVHVFATTNPNAPAYEIKDGVRYHRLEWRMATSLVSRMMLPPALSSSWIKKVNRAAAAGIVRCLAPYIKYSVFAEIFAEPVAAIKPDIVHAHDLICLPAGHTAALMAGARLVYDAHELEVHRHPPLSLPQKLMVRRMETKYGRKADAVITVGRLISQVLSKMLRRQDITVIYNSPIRLPSQRSIRADLKIGTDTPLIIYVGKVTAGRGIEKIIDLLPQLPDAVFAAVGPCDRRAKEKLENKALSAGLLSRFHLLPPVAPPHVVNYIRGADVGVIPIEIRALSYRYAMPNKLFEMSFAGVPMISNMMDEISEFMRDMGNGEAIDFDKDYLVCYTISKIIANKSNYAISHEAQERLESLYSWPTQAQTLLALYDRLLGKPAATAEGGAVNDARGAA